MKHCQGIASLKHGVCCVGYQLSLRLLKTKYKNKTQLKATTMNNITTWWWVSARYDHQITMASNRKGVCPATQFIHETVFALGSHYPRRVVPGSRCTLAHHHALKFCLEILCGAFHWPDFGHVTMPAKYPGKLNYDHTFYQTMEEDFNSRM